MGSVPNQPHGGVLAPGPSKHMRSSRGFLGCSEPCSPPCSHLTPLLLGFSPSHAFFAHPHLPPRASPTSCLEPGAPPLLLRQRIPWLCLPQPKMRPGASTNPQSPFSSYRQLADEPFTTVLEGKTSPCWRPVLCRSMWHRPIVAEQDLEHHQDTILELPTATSCPRSMASHAGTRSRSLVDVALSKSWRTSLAAVLQPPPAARRTIPEQINPWSLWF